MTLLIILIGLIISTAVAHIIGNVAKDRKIGYLTAFLLSFLLSPLLGILIVIASPLNTTDLVENKIESKPKNLSKDDIIVISIGIVCVICLFLVLSLVE